MKTIKAFLIALSILGLSTVQAQVSVNVNIGTAPDWGPVGYSEVEYYYLPDVEAYYDIRASQFIYFGSGRWIRARYLPTRYRNYDLYNGYKVVLNDYHGNRPYVNYKVHKVKYYKGYKGKKQKTIGYKPAKHKDHDDHNDDRHGNGNGKHGKGKH